MTNTLAEIGKEIPGLSRHSSGLVLEYENIPVIRRANHSKPVQPFAQKYSAFVLTQITRITPPVSRQMRGVGHRHERAVRCDGREGRETYAPEAYGEVVWFGRRGAGAKS